MAELMANYIIEFDALNAGNLFKFQTFTEGCPDPLFMGVFDPATLRCNAGAVPADMHTCTHMYITVRCALLYIHE